MDGCVDLVFMSQIYHHLPDPAAVARECRRVLRVGGYVCVRTGTRENDVVVPNFFPAVRTMLDTNLPSGDEVRSNLATAGFLRLGRYRNHKCRVRRCTRATSLPRRRNGP